MKRWFALLPSLALAVSGCGPRKPIGADEYYAMASSHLREGAYNQAVEEYRELLDEHPFSEYSEEAELKIGVAHYKNDACPEAIAAFTDFQRRHPTSPYLPYVGYLLGQCYEQQMRPADRDQSASQNAHAYYQALIQQHPGSPFAELAREQLQHCRETLAGHELDVAQFYARRGNSKAAEYRVLDLVNRFNDTDVAGDALYMLGDLYREQGRKDQATLAFAAVVYHHPEHGVAEKAERALAQLGDGEGPSGGDPLAVLKAQTGRARNVAITQAARPQDTKPARRGGPSLAPGAGFGLPSGAGGPYPRRF